jgi:hypothetical protein
MLRRSFTAGAVALATVPAAGGVAHAQAGKPMLVYLGDPNDGANKMWRNRSEPAFKKSDAFKKLDYRVVSGKPDDLLKEATWPADARWVLAEFRNTKEGKDLWPDQPHFILAQDKKIVLVVRGNGNWSEQMLPKIAEVTGAKAS